MLELSCNFFVRLSSRDATRRPSAPQRCQTFTRQSIGEYPPPAQRWNGRILKNIQQQLAGSIAAESRIPSALQGQTPPFPFISKDSSSFEKLLILSHLSFCPFFFCRADKIDAFRGSFLASGRWITMWHFSSGCYATPFYSSAAVMTLIVSFQMSCH